MKLYPTNRTPTHSEKKLFIITFSQRVSEFLVSVKKAVTTKSLKLVEFYFVDQCSNYWCFKLSTLLLDSNVNIRSEMFLEAVASVPAC